MNSSPKFTRPQAMFLQDAIINAITPAYTVLQMVDIALSGGQYQAILKLGQDAQKRLKDAALVLQKLQIEDKAQPGPMACEYPARTKKGRLICFHPRRPSRAILCSPEVCPFGERNFPFYPAAPEEEGGSNEHDFKGR